MTPINRREFLGLAAAGFVIAGAGDVISAEPANAAKASVLYQLSSKHKHHVAWTVDDGFSSKAVAGYIKLAKEHNLRFTFFVTPRGDGWLDNKKALQPLVESGQIQLANHTKTHADLTKLGFKGIQDELSGAGSFIKKHFGVSAKPYFRPPFGYYNDYVLNVAADMGYTRCVMWYGSMGDSGHTSSYGVRRNARTWMKGGHIFIAHANNMYAMNQRDYFARLLIKRNLKTKTLDDIYGT